MNNLEEKRSAMLAIIEDWRSSGKSKKQYCIAKGMNEATFYYWFSRSKKGSSGTGNFIPVEKSSSRREIEVIYPNGVRLKVENELGLLSQLIHLY